MKIMNCLILTAAMMAALPHAASARGNAYLGLAMFNPTYKSDDGDHRSTGLMARFGYRFAPHLAVEAHGGGSIGSESGATPDDVQAQMSSLYGAFVRADTPFKYGTFYALGGYMHGTRVIKYPSGASFTDDDSNKAFGVGMELTDDGGLGFALEFIRYFGNQYYTLDAWNLGVVTHF